MPLARKTVSSRGIAGASHACWRATGSRAGRSLVRRPGRPPARRGRASRTQARQHRGRPIRRPDAPAGGCDEDYRLDPGRGTRPPDSAAPLRQCGGQVHGQGRDRAGPRLRKAHVVVGPGRVDHRGEGDAAGDGGHQRHPPQPEDGERSACRELVAQEHQQGDGEQRDAAEDQDDGPPADGFAGSDRACRGPARHAEHYRGDQPSRSVAERYRPPRRVAAGRQAGAGEHRGQPRRQAEQPHAQKPPRPAVAGHCDQRPTAHGDEPDQQRRSGGEPPQQPLGRLPRAPLPGTRRPDRHAQQREEHQGSAGHAKCHQPETSPNSPTRPAASSTRPAAASRTSEADDNPWSGCCAPSGAACPGTWR
jgi:hypothetical protein